ncbi:PhaM family polyhydroxyalkanoate granule multifunctional regulatory protein [Limnohabitans sp. Rim8]|uniref:PhaM family polyhydroxyalkanoate granule multifunctional regulatory protein n=1 Tax=Limnohabitans sp. Rim8 TaxID=1100718 RepID=UPI0033059879
MSDTSAFGFGQFVPGFDFLKNLAQSSQQANAGATSAMPNMGSWVAPTLSIEELDKRIQELKAVQFWLDQNATALKATIQAMEVQKMTLSTLQGMNVNMADLAKAFTANVPYAMAATPAEPAAPVHTPEPAPTEAAHAAKADATASEAAAKPAVDPMQWWGSLTEQFQNIAAAALKDVAAQALKNGPKKASKKAASAASAKTASKAGAPGASKKTTARKTPAKTAGKNTAAQKATAPRQRA